MPTPVRPDATVASDFPSSETQLGMAVASADGWHTQWLLERQRRERSIEGRIIKEIRVTKIKVLTHILAVAGGTVAAFMLSPAGQAIVHQYPRLAPVAGFIGMLMAVYHDPKTVAQ